MDTNITKIITTSILGVAFVLAVWLGVSRVDQYLKQNAVDECAKVSRYEKTITAENVKLYYPLADVYKNCLKDKGIINK
ncbi:MAG: hypothetical protein Q7S61_03210 [bacterium]|nr:hypothetical protein [bacterium]